LGVALDGGHGLTAPEKVYDKAVQSLLGKWRTQNGDFGQFRASSDGTGGSNYRYEP
jgi:hypothetical protein